MELMQIKQRMENSADREQSDHSEEDMKPFERKTDRTPLRGDFNRANMFITRHQNATITKSKNKGGLTTEMPPIVIAKNKIKPAQSFNIYT